MTRYHPSQAQRGLWSPNSGILGGGNILPSWVPRPRREYSSLQRGDDLAKVCPSRVPAFLRGVRTWGPAVSPALLSLFFQYWAFSDIQTGRVLTKVTDETSGCCKLSPECWALHSLCIVYFSVLFSCCSFVLKSTCCGCLLSAGHVLAQ